jgi:SH3 domain protein
MPGKRSAFLACVLLSGVVSLPVRAETGYVTDVLSLGLHRAEDTSDAPFRTLRSGDAFEILARDGYYARVQLPDGTTGYVKANFIVTEKPARAIVDETAAERDRLAAELEDLKVAFAEPALRMDELQQQLASLEAERDAVATRAAELEAANRELSARHERYRHSLPYGWVAGAALICLVAGILAGLWWVDRQIRRRHGGVRVV